MTEIVDKESGADAKKKIIESINKRNKKTLKELIKDGITNQSEERKPKIT